MHTATMIHDSSVNEACLEVSDWVFLVFFFNLPVYTLELGKWLAVIWETWRCELVSLLEIRGVWFALKKNGAGEVTKSQGKFVPYNRVPEQFHTK